MSEYQATKDNGRSQNAPGRFVDIRLHRPAFTLDDSCAEESAWLRAGSADDAPDLYDAEPSNPGTPCSAEKVAGVLLAVAIGLVGALALVAWGVQ